MEEVARITKERLRVAEERLAHQEEQLRRMREDPAYVELVIRRRLGYAKPDELIFRFEPTE
jgi:cell division protein FtsB